MLHGDVKLQKSSIDIPRDPLCNSVVDPLCNSAVVAIDNRHSNSNSNSKALGGNGKSKGKDKIEHRCNVSEMLVASRDVESCIASSGSSKDHDVEICRASNGNGKPIGDSISNGMQRLNDTNDDVDDDVTDRRNMHIARCDVHVCAGNPPPLGKVESQVLGPSHTKET